MTPDQPASPAPLPGIPGFWDALRAARSSFLALDYDGTLAPFMPARMEARPLDGTADLIEHIRDRTGGAVAVISGRPLSELTQLIDIPGITMVGSHGFEFRHPDGTKDTRKPSRGQRQGIAAAWAACSRQEWGPRVETKAAGLALHTRGLPAHEERTMERRAMECWEPIAREHNLEVRRFNGGIELRCPGTDKGTALREILARIPREALCVYVGDDETDEDAFRALEGRGIGIRVGHPDVPTRAAGFLSDVHAVKGFLCAWASLAPHAQSMETVWRKEDWQ